MKNDSAKVMERPATVAKRPSFLSKQLDRLPRWQVGRVDVTSVVRETADEIADNDLPGLAAEIAHHSILAIFPFLLFLAGLTAIADELFGIENMTDRIMERMGPVLPADAASLIRSFLQEVVDSEGTGASVFGLIGALWSGSAAVGSAMKGLNRIRDADEDRTFFKRKLVAIGLTLVFGGSLLVAAILMVGGRLVASGTGDALGWEAGARALMGWVLWPASIALILAAVTVLYWIGPSGEKSFRWVTPGAFLFAVAWVSASAIFSLYVSNFGSYNRTYGSLAAVIILLVWLYWSNLLLLVGAQLNTVLERRYGEEAEGLRRRGGEAAKAQP